jgi:hypothetical protein
MTINGAGQYCTACTVYFMEHPQKACWFICNKKSTIIFKKERLCCTFQTSKLVLLKIKDNTVCMLHGTPPESLLVYS